MHVNVLGSHEKGWGFPVTAYRRPGTMRFGSTAEVLAECKLKYYRVSECTGEQPAPMGRWRGCPALDVLQGGHLEVLEDDAHVIIHLLPDALKYERPQLILQQLHVMPLCQIPDLVPILPLVHIHPHNVLHRVNEGAAHLHLLLGRLCKPPSSWTSPWWLRIPMLSMRRWHLASYTRAC